MAYAESARGVDVRQTITTELDRALTRARVIAEHAEELGDHLCGAAPRPIEANEKAAGVPQSVNLNLLLSQLHDQLARAEGAMARLEKGLR